MKMDIQRLRNLTTGRLHTEMGHVYQDIELLTGSEGIMTHMLPNAARALEPYLRGLNLAPRLWDGEYDATHTGTVDVEPMNETEKKLFWKRYAALPNPFARD